MKSKQKYIDAINTVRELVLEVQAATNQYCTIDITASDESSCCKVYVSYWTVPKPKAIIEVDPVKAVEALIEEVAAAKCPFVPQEVHLTDSTGKKWVLKTVDHESEWEEE